MAGYICLTLPSPAAAASALVAPASPSGAGRVGTSGTTGAGRMPASSNQRRMTTSLAHPRASRGHVARSGVLNLVPASRVLYAGYRIPFPSYLYWYYKSMFEVFYGTN